MKSKFEDIIHWGDILPNFCLMLGIYTVYLVYEYRARKVFKENDSF